jgi:hypothetical protein
MSVKSKTKVMRVFTYLAANGTANKLLGGSSRLVPRAGAAVGIVPGDGTSRRGGGTGELHGSVGSVILGLGLSLLGFALGLS